MSKIEFCSVEIFRPALETENIVELTVGSRRLRQRGNSESRNKERITQKVVTAKMEGLRKEEDLDKLSAKRKSN